MIELLTATDINEVIESTGKGDNRGKWVNESDKINLSDNSCVEVITQPGIIQSANLLPSPASYLISQIHHLASTYWEQPDHQALNVILAFQGAYYLHERNPLWLHIIGESSSGKTELGMAPIALPLAEYHMLDDLTGNTLMSGLTKGKNGGKRNSFMHRVGLFGLIYMEDFTTFLEKDERMVGAVAGQLRRVYDGFLDKQTGVERRDDKDSNWTGRVSWITAMTPGAERKWIRHNPMGERFSIIRWRAATNHEAVSRKVLAQSASEAEQRWLGEDGTVNEEVSGPRKWISWLAERLVRGAKHDAPVPPGIDPQLLATVLGEFGNIEEAAKPRAPSDELVYDAGLYALSEIVTQLRSVPPRPDGRNIGAKDLDRESGGRLQHQLLKVARGWAHINRRQVIAEDMQLVKRVAEDTIPLSKKPIVTALVESARVGVWLSTEELRHEAKYQTREALVWQLQDLEALGVIHSTADNTAANKYSDWATEWKLTESFEELWHKGFKD